VLTGNGRTNLVIVYGISLENAGKHCIKVGAYSQKWALRENNSYNHIAASLKWDKIPTIAIEFNPG
jgi:hypothetical protein